MWENLKEKYAGPTAEAVIDDLILLSKGGLQNDKEIRKAQISLLCKLTDLMRGDDFAKREREICGQLARRLADDEDVMEARNCWEKLDGNAKMKALQRIATIQAQELGLESRPAIAFAPTKEREKGLGGYVDQNDGNVYVFFASEAGDAYSFDTMCDTIVHEMTHVRQRRLAQLYNEGGLGKSDPEFTMGMIFAANLIPGLYVSGSKENPDAYPYQPVEFHAMQNGPTTVQMLNKLLEKK